MTARPREHRLKAHRRGHRAEQAAVLLLRLKGYRILARRYRIDGGELDIVARRGDTIAFIEVKSRPTLEAAMTAISPTKRRRLSRAARVWLTSHPWAVHAVLRGDAVYVAPWRWPHHAVAVFELDLG